jgi:hypothetical protein
MGRLATESATAQLQRVVGYCWYDSGSARTNGIGRRRRVNGVFNGRTPVDPGRTVRVKVSSTSVVIESYEQCASSTVVRIVTIQFIV